jgi:methyl-accepting chemotaxis protein
MKWYYDLKIGTKLLSGFVLVALIAGVIGYVGITSLKNLTASGDVLYAKNTVPLGDIGVLSTAFQRQRTNVLEFIIAKNEAGREDLRKKITARTADIADRSVEFEKSIVSDEVRSTFSTFTQAQKAWLEVKEKILRLA